MAQTKLSRRWFELAVIAVLLSIVLWRGGGYYRSLVLDAQRLAVQMQADNFARAVQALRRYWQVKYRPRQVFEMGEFRFAVNERGWPLAAAPVGQPLSVQGGMTQVKCRALQRALIYAPNSDTVSSTVRDFDVAPEPSLPLLRFGVNLTPAGHCRYHLEGTDEPHLFFEYRPGKGVIAASEAAKR